MSDDLVKRLRKHIAVYFDDRGHVFEDDALCDAAADRIEELEAEVSTVKKSLTVAQAKLAQAEWLLVDAAVQLEEGKIKTRRNRAALIQQFLAELKGQDDE